MYYSIILVKNSVNKFCLDNIIKILTIFFKMIHTYICSSKIKQSNKYSSEFQLKL